MNNSNEFIGNGVGAVSGAAILGLVMNKMGLDDDSQHIVLYFIPAVSIIISWISIRVIKYFNKRYLKNKNKALKEYHIIIENDDTLTDDAKRISLEKINQERIIVLTDLAAII